MNLMKATLPEWASILMIGSPGVGVLEFNIGLVKEYLEEGSAVIFVTADMSPKDIMDTMGRFGINVEDSLGRRLFLIDYHSSLLGSYERTPPQQQDGVRKVIDIEGIMFNVDSVVSKTGTPVKIFLHSLSTLFLYNQPNVVLKFYQISSSRIRSEFGSAIFTVHEGVHDEKAVNHLMAMADGVIEMRFDDDLRRMMRIRHMRNAPISSKWVPFDIRQIEGSDRSTLLEWR